MFATRSVAAGSLSAFNFHSVAPVPESMLVVAVPRAVKSRAKTSVAPFRIRIFSVSPPTKVKFGSARRKESSSRRTRTMSFASSSRDAYARSEMHSIHITRLRR